MKPEDFQKIRKGAKVTWEGGKHAGTIKNVYLSAQGLVLQVQTVPGSIVCCNVPIMEVESLEPVR